MVVGYFTVLVVLVVLVVLMVLMVLVVMGCGGGNCTDCSLVVIAFFLVL